MVEAAKGELTDKQARKLRAKLRFRLCGFSLTRMWCSARRATRTAWRRELVQLAARGFCEIAGVAALGGGGEAPYRAKASGEGGGFGEAFAGDADDGGVRGGGSGVGLRVGAAVEGCADPGGGVSANADLLVTGDRTHFGFLYARGEGKGDCCRRSRWSGYCRPDPVPRVHMSPTRLKQWLNLGSARSGSHCGATARWTRAGSRASIAISRLRNAPSISPASA